jgi:DNA helicase HerA-like ATPase
VVEAVINKLTRLGRVRRMGVVFATHSPADLNDLVIQLTNTKIAMRSEPKVLERVDMAEYAGSWPTPKAESPWRRALSTGHTP